MFSVKEIKIMNLLIMMVILLCLMLKFYVQVQKEWNMSTVDYKKEIKLMLIIPKVSTKTNY